MSTLSHFPTCEFDDRVSGCLLQRQGTWVVTMQRNITAMRSALPERDNVLWLTNTAFRFLLQYLRRSDHFSQFLIDTAMLTCSKDDDVLYLGGIIGALPPEATTQTQMTDNWKSSFLPLGLH